jgi:phage terminase large subunit
VEVVIGSTYDPLPRQIVFHTSRAKVRGYGGAMGGGKSRALCEDIFQDMLDYPGILIPIFRATHVSIGLSTKRTMIQEVIPPELMRYCQRKSSGGQDYVRLPNGSEVHFVGLDDPERWFSTEIGGFAVDEAHQVSEEDVVKLISRLRQPNVPKHVRRVRLCFNPENPGHWLYRWFISEAERTDTGYRKKELFPLEATRPIGDCEFVFASARDNPYLDEDYVDQNLAGMPDLMKRRYLDGEWLYTSGTSYFDVEALTAYEQLVAKALYRFDFRPTSTGGQARQERHRDGKISVYADPKPDRRYAIGADVASGSGRDFSAAYIVDLSSMEFVAEFHGRLDEDLYAEQLHFLGRWYNTALIAVEHQAGFGNATLTSLRDGKGGRPPYPNLYRHKLELQVDLPTTKRWGYPITLQTRTPLLTGLQKALRERALPFVTHGLLTECSTFVNHDTGTTPRAQDGCHDDRVMAAALTLEMHRQKGHHPRREARLERKRRKASRKALYPWKTAA